MTMQEEISARIADEPVILWMKGTPTQPACGFSSRVVNILASHGVAYASVNVLEDPAIRGALSAVSQWPTIPQLFINGELVGGCDIVMEMAETGELAEALGVDKPTAVADVPSTPATPAPLNIVEHRTSGIELPTINTSTAPGTGRGYEAKRQLMEDALEKAHVAEHVQERQDALDERAREAALRDAISDE